MSDYDDYDDDVQDRSSGGTQVAGRRYSSDEFTSPVRKGSPRRSSRSQSRSRSQTSYSSRSSRSRRRSQPKVRSRSRHTHSSRSRSPSSNSKSSSADARKKRNHVPKRKGSDARRTKEQHYSSDEEPKKEKEKRHKEDTKATEKGDAQATAMPETSAEQEQDFHDQALADNVQKQDMASQVDVPDFDLLTRAIFMTQQLTTLLPQTGDDVGTKLRQFQEEQHSKLQGECQRLEEERRIAAVKLEEERQQKQLEREARRVQVLEERRRREEERVRIRRMAMHEQEARHAALEMEHQRQLEVLQGSRQSIAALAKLKQTLHQTVHRLELYATESAALDVSLGILASPTSLNAVSENILPPLLPSPVLSTAHRIEFGDIHLVGIPQKPSVTPNSLLPSVANDRIPPHMPNIHSTTQAENVMSPPQGTTAAPTATSGDMVQKATHDTTASYDDPGNSAKAPTVGTIGGEQFGGVCAAQHGRAQAGEMACRSVTATQPEVYESRSDNSAAKPGYPQDTFTRQRTTEQLQLAPDQQSNDSEDSDETDVDVMPQEDERGSRGENNARWEPHVARTIAGYRDVPVVEVTPPSLTSSLQSELGHGDQFYPTNEDLQFESSPCPDAEAGVTYSLSDLPELPIEMPTFPPLPSIPEPSALPFPSSTPLSLQTSIPNQSAETSHIPPDPQLIKAAVDEVRFGLLLHFRQQMQELRSQFVTMKKEVLLGLSQCKEDQNQGLERALLGLQVYFNEEERKRVGAQLQVVEAEEQLMTKMRTRDAEVSAIMQKLATREAEMDGTGRRAILANDEANGRVDIVREHLAESESIITTFQMGTWQCWQSALTKRDGELKQEGAHHIQWRGVLEAQQRDLEERAVAASKKEEELAAAAIQWQLQLKEVELRLQHLQIQQQSLDAQMQDQETLRGRLQLECQCRHQQLLQSEEEWKRNVAASQQEMEVQRCAITDTEKQLRHREHTITQKETRLAAQEIDLAKRLQELEERELRLREQEAAHQVRIELVEADLTRQKQHVAQQWEHLQQKSKEVATDMANLRHLMVMARLPLVENSMHRLSGAHHRQDVAKSHESGRVANGLGRVKSAPAMGITNGRSFGSHRRTPLWNRVPGSGEAAERPVSPDDINFHQVQQAQGTVPGWSLCTTQLQPS